MNTRTNSRIRPIACILGIIMVLSLVLGMGAGAETNAADVLPSTEQFIGSWESDLSLIPEYVEMGITGTILAVFSEDGTLETFYDGEPDDTFGFFIYAGYYVVADGEGTVESSKPVFSDDGQQIDFYDLDGNHMITYAKVS